jgi:hypothetical protein
VRENLSRRFPKKVRCFLAAAHSQNVNLPPGINRYPKNVRNAANRFFWKKSPKRELFCNAWIKLAVIQSLWHNSKKYLIKGSPL